MHMSQDFTRWLARQISLAVSAQQQTALDMTLPVEIPPGAAPRFKRESILGCSLWYEDTAHLYFLEHGKERFPLVSATTLVGLFTERFDTPAMSLHCARKSRYDCDFLDKSGWGSLTEAQKAERIAQAWQVNSLEAAGYGTALHMAGEYAALFPGMDDKDIYLQVQQRCGTRHARPVILSALPGIRAILDGFRSQGYRCVAEPLLVEPSMCLAGQSDLVMVHPEKKKIWILDYKTNRKMPGSTRAYAKMKGFFSPYDCTEWYHYCIQLSLYWLMLQHRYPGYGLENMTLLWVEPETGTIRPMALEAHYWQGVIGDFRQYFLQSGIPGAVYG